MDISERYYRVYQHCLAESKRPDRPVQVLSKQEFWGMKRSRIPETQIGILSGLEEPQAEQFASLRRQTVHTLPYLTLDTLVPGAVAALEKVQQMGADLVVMTMRRECELEAAFSEWDLGRFFPPERCYCLPNDYIKTADVTDKPLLMAKALAELPPASETWMVGDTEADIIAAKTNDVKVIAVLSGIRDRAQLEIHQPDLIVNHLAEAVEVICDRSLPAVGAGELINS